MRLSHIKVRQVKRFGMRAVVNTTVATISHGTISRLRMGMGRYFFILDHCCFQVCMILDSVCVCVCVCACMCVCVCESVHLKR